MLQRYYRRITSGRAAQQMPLLASKLQATHYMFARYSLGSFQPRPKRILSPRTSHVFWGTTALMAHSAQMLQLPTLFPGGGIPVHCRASELDSLQMQTSGCTLRYWSIIPQGRFSQPW